MAKKGSKTPKAPDPWKTAQAQAAANKEAIRESAIVNQIGVNTPYGRQFYTGEVGQPDRTLNVELTPGGEEARGYQEELATLLSGYGAGELGPSVLDRLSSPDSSAVENALYERGAGRFEPRFERQEERLHSRLVNQGVPPGSRAYEQAMEQFREQQDEAYENLALSSTVAGAGENRAQRSQAINELSALLQGAPAIGQPPAQMPGQYQIAPPDIAGLTSQQYAGDVSAYNAQQARAAQEMGGLYSLGGTAAALALLSDRRLKRDIQWLGKHKGVNWYSFRYLWDRARQVGVMAQEILASHPQAVSNVGGWLCVDYGKLNDGLRSTAS